jgi:hypothetical protein
MANALHIRTVGTSFADAFIDEDEHVFDATAYALWLRNNRSRFGGLGTYLPGKLHDSRVISWQVSDSAFRIVLNDAATCTFARALVNAKQLAIAPNRLLFPLELEFKTQGRALLHSVAEDGELVAADSLRVDEYLYEHIGSITAAALSIGFCFWQRSEDGAPGQRVVLLATVTGIETNPQQATAWQGIFGSAYDAYYRHFIRAFNDDRFVCGDAESLQLIAECAQ